MLYGMSNVPGAPGNFPEKFLAGGPSFEIGPRSPFKGMSREQLEELKKFDDRPGDLQRYYDRINAPGPQLPFPMAGIPGSSNLPGAIGNMGGMQNFQQLLDQMEEETRTQQPQRFTPPLPTSYPRRHF